MKNKSKAADNGTFTELLATLKGRFEKNMNRHEKVQWADIEKRLLSNSEKLFSLYEMEQSGGEPDLVLYDQKKGECIFYDCSPESPSGRRSICFDRQALDTRKEFKPGNNAMDMVEAMGVQMLNEEEYRYLQTLGKFDTKTSSWIQTPPEIRKLGGALFADRRYNHVFVYHNGAQSYYAARGFRAKISI